MARNAGSGSSTDRPSGADLLCVHRREWTLTGEHAHDLVGREIADGMDRLFRVVRRVRCHDRVRKREQRIGWLPVALLGWLLLDVVDAGPRDPAVMQRA